MPAREVLSTETVNGSLESFEDHLRSIARKHAKALTGVRIERRNRGAGSGPISEAVEVERDDGETDDELVESVVVRVVAVVKRDAARARGRNTPNAGRVASWCGVVVLLDSRGKTKKERELAEIPLDIEDPDAFVSIENEAAMLVKSARELVAAFGATTVNHERVWVSREKQLAKRDKQYAKAMQRLSGALKSSGKWDYRKRKEREKTERSNEKHRARQAKSKHIWEAVESVGSDYKEVATIFATWWTTHATPGGPPPAPPMPPTPAEVAEVLGDHEQFEKRYDLAGESVSVKALVAEMLAQQDARQRMRLGKLLLALLNAMPAADAQLLKLCMVSKLGKKRALEVATWLSLPV